MGGSPDHGVATQAVGVFMRPEHVGDDLGQPVLGEGIVRPRHVHLCGTDVLFTRCARGPRGRRRTETP